MTFTEKIFALKKVPPFDRVLESELLIIAEIGKERRFSPGELICEDGKILNRLIIVIEGSILAKKTAETAPIVFGLESLLFDLPTAETMIASPTHGALCLMISKGHFFTIMYECPELAVGFLDTCQYAVDRFYET